jgi:hypothetical protein
MRLSLLPLILLTLGCRSWGNFWDGPSLKFSSTHYAFAQFRAVSTVRPSTSPDLIGCESSPSLPSGLSLGTTNCAITGTPDGPVQASAAYTITAKNNGGIASATIYIRISGTTAVRVYGQSSFTTGGTGTSATQFNVPFQAAITSSAVLVCDQLNHRILTFPGTSTTATSVYGQGGSFVTSTANNGGISVGLNAPAGIVFDGSGYYVTDTTNHRVLYFAGGLTSPTRVYGQFGSFSTNIANNGGISANSLNNPRSTTVASDGIYIVDGGNSRVLFYGGTSTTASRVYGQSGSFVTNIASVTADGLSNPRHVGVDAMGVYISDQDNSRILYYIGASTTASRVYGQNGSFTSSSASTTANGLWTPAGIFLVENGLYVADFGNNRLLYFSGTSTTATAVYGQAGSFIAGIANSGGLSGDSLSGPMMVTVADDGIYMVDMNNNRVLVY